ncbi:unnamed protein product [Coccothraustes coccothraustes]
MILGARRAGASRGRWRWSARAPRRRWRRPRAGADIVLLDNLSPQALAAAAARVKAAHPGLTLEASGAIALETLPQFLGPHVDVVSMGCLTHSAPGLDFALKVLEPPKSSLEPQKSSLEP